MKESYLYRKLKQERVQCSTCAHYCVLDRGEYGRCGVRKNKQGELYALNYENCVALSSDPVEKKPLFHFLPGTSTLSMATVGCNFRCDNCQNWHISQGPKINKGSVPGQKITSLEIVEKALEKDVPSLSYTYTEPTIFLEYALDTMKLAHERGLKNIWVTNGFLSKESFDLVAPFLDAVNVDLKSFDNDFYVDHCGARLQPVLETLKRIKTADIWLEVTTLVIPTLSDDLEMLSQIARFINQKLGSETPWHLSRFSGVISWKLKNLPDTSVQTLKKAHEIGKSQGLKYVYTGNLPGMETEDTFCPRCGEKIIDRSGYRVQRKDKSGKCAQCGQKIKIIIN